MSLLEPQVSCHHVFLGPIFDLNASDEMEEFSSLYDIYPGMGNSIPLTTLSSLPHLQYLTIRLNDCWFVSCFRAVVDILKNAPPLQRLTINIVLLLIEQLDHCHFPIFKALTEYSSSLHVWGISERDIVIIFGEYTALIEQGVLDIHMDEDAPSDPRVKIMHNNIVFNPKS